MKNISDKKFFNKVALFWSKKSVTRKTVLYHSFYSILFLWSIYYLADLFLNSHWCQLRLKRTSACIYLYVYNFGAGQRRWCIYVYNFGAGQENNQCMCTLCTLVNGASGNVRVQQPNHRHLDIQGPTVIHFWCNWDTNITSSLHHTPWG